MYNAKPLATEGLERPGGYFIRQLHLRPTPEDRGKPIPNAWTFSLPYLGRVKIIHVIRDPRDVIVSVFYYWQIENLQSAVDAVCLGERDPIKVHGSWSWHVGTWLDLSVPVVRYEDLSRDPRGELVRVLDTLHLPYRDNYLDPVVERQSFDRKREQIQEDGATRPYGRHIQLFHLRKGTVGDYREHLNRAQLEQVWETCGRVMRMCGYLKGEV